ncbi:MAG TPA: radical SAM protein [Gemmatimonadaceae bacterium]|nr:radical SAM protein [Gemmatimonadaceae bacterium]
MSKSLYLINPRSKFPTYFSAEVFAASGFQPATAMADLAIPTLAALAPADFDVQLCDENVSTLDPNVDSDFVGITGKITQLERMREIAAHFRSRGKTVIIGGPQASLSPETVRDYADILVTGEIENIADQFFADLGSGTWKPQYVGDKPDLDKTPVPRWDLYPNSRAAMSTVQTSRGCPFECEFCDVIQYLGRNQRHKSPARVLAELDVIAGHGYRTVFLADDNFTVYRSRAKELLSALKAWNEDGGKGMTFTTQVSIDCARDPEMLRLCAEAGLTNVFIGIETSNESSLRETKKRQNVGIDLRGQVARIVRHGIAVTGGMIVGFDADTKDIFEQQHDFAMSIPVPVFSLGSLVAPAATPLYSRMARQNRLVENASEVAGAPWDTNLIPLQMSREELIAGVRWLCNRLYRPEAFAERVFRFINEFGKESGTRTRLRSTKQSRPIEIESLQLAGRVARLGADEASMLRRVQGAVARKPEVSAHVVMMLGQYMQVRHSYAFAGLWDRKLAEQTSPRWEEFSSPAARIYSGAPQAAPPQL